MEQHIQQLQDYIRQQYRSGLHPDEISQQLQTVGWPLELIHQAFAAVQAEMVPSGYVQPNPAPPVISDQPLVETPTAGGRRRGRIRTGWQLFKVSFSIFQGNKYLLRYLLLTAASVAATLILFIIIFILGRNVFFPRTYYGGSDGMSAIGYVIVFIYYVCMYFCINFFAAALALNIFDIFKGQRYPLRVYIRAAWSRAGTIFFFSIICATVGFILNYVVERIRYVGWILSWILGTLWSLGTLFVLPIIMNDPNVSAPKSIKESVKFFKATWGENVAAKVSINAPLALLNMTGLAVAIIACITAAYNGLWQLLLVIIPLYWLLAVSLMIIGSFANSILNVALFYYASYHQVPPAFSAELLNSVFIKRKRSRLGKKLSPDT